MELSLIENTRVRTFAVRLGPGDDLKHSITFLVQKHNIKAGYIAACVGSLHKAALRFANQTKVAAFEEKFEIISLSGTLSTQGVHLHISVANSQGTIFGGHLMENNIVYTTAELVLVEMQDIEFERELDAVTGYKELKIQSRTL